MSNYFTENNWASIVQETIDFMKKTIDSTEEPISSNVNKISPEEMFMICNPLSMKNAIEAYNYTKTRLEEIKEIICKSTSGDNAMTATVQQGYDGEKLLWLGIEFKMKNHKNEKMAWLGISYDKKYNCPYILQMYHYYKNVEDMPQNEKLENNVYYEDINSKGKYALFTHFITPDDWNNLIMVMEKDKSDKILKKIINCINKHVFYEE